MKRSLKNKKAKYCCRNRQIRLFLRKRMENPVIKGIVISTCIIGLLLMICFVVILINSKAYHVKEFKRNILVPDGDMLELSDSDNLIISSSLVDVKSIHSGDLTVNISNPLNLKHPLCSEINDEEIQIPIFAYLLHHKKYGYFLIDTGCESSYVDSVYGPMKGLLLPYVMPKTDLEAINAIESQLSEDVLNNIKAVFFTHLHFDHTSGIPALPDNLVYIAGKGEKSYSIKWFLEANHFKKSDTIYMLDFDKDTSKTFPIGKAIDIFGDKTVWAISTPGHSKGHISYLINGEDGPVLIAGDACILNKNLEMGIGSGTSSADIKKDEETLNKIRTFLKDNPSVEIWYGHDFPKK